LRLYREADKKVILDGVKTVDMFEVSATKARQAVEAVKARKAVLLKQDTIRTLKL
jgi:hypothetical protein